MNYIGHGGRLQFLFAGAHYEVNLTSGAITKYYFAGASRIAMRKYTIPVSMEVEYMLGDHLGSTSLTTDSNGNKISEIRYKPWGETRYSWTDPALDTSPTYAVTKYQYTGQYSYATEFGLHFYNARWYDSLTGRFAQADTIVPGGVQGYDRYAYSNNSPVVYVDPSGHAPDCNGLSGYRCEIRQRKWREARHLGEYAYGEEDDNGGNVGLPDSGDLGDNRGFKAWLLRDHWYGCTGTYAQCFSPESGTGLIDFEPYAQLDPEQFEELVMAVYDLLKKRDGGLIPLFRYDSLRGRFDTPIYNGWYDDVIVCLGTKCSHRSEVNYFAQGMWAAAANETLEQAYDDAADFKNWGHQGSTPSDAIKYWIMYGYEMYLAIDAAKTGAR